MTETDTRDNMFVMSELSDETIEQYTEQLVVLAEGKQEEIDTLNVFLDSPGGDIQHALTLYELTEAVKTQGITVNMFALGSVYSGAIVFFLAGTNRFCLPHTTFLLHDGAHEFTDSSFSNKELLAFIDSSEYSMNKYKAILYNKTIIDREYLDLLMSDESILKSPQLQELKFVDAVLDGEKLNKVLNQEDF